MAVPGEPPLNSNLPASLVRAAVPASGPSTMVTTASGTEREPMSKTVPWMWYSADSCPSGATGDGEGRAAEDQGEGRRLAGQLSSDQLEPTARLRLGADVGRIELPSLLDHPGGED